MESSETILILLGKPGVGKTTLIKYFMREMSVDVFNRDYGLPSSRRFPRSIGQAETGDTLFAYAKGNDVLGKEEFWAGLTSNDTKMLILDDLDFALLPRDSDGNEFMSNFLSFADGIFDNNVKIVMTTNITYSQIDPAALRAGRCFDILDLQPMTYIEGKIFWNEKLKHDGALFIEKFNPDEPVFQSEIMALHERVNNDAVALDYLEDINLSVRHSYNKQRKVGF